LNAFKGLCAGEGRGCGHAADFYVGHLVQLRFAVILLQGEEFGNGQQLGSEYFLLF
jgi:hypothetical protein